VNELTGEIWEAAGGSPGSLAVVAVPAPAQTLLPSTFDVDRLARASLAVAGLAAAEYWSVRCAQPIRRVVVDPRAAAAAFVQERLLRPEGWDLPEPWDELAGDYPALDGWIRLHTNYEHHRSAALTVLGVPDDRDRVGEAVAGWKRVELERAIVDAGGCAAAMHSRTAWLAGAEGGATEHEPPARIAERESGFTGGGWADAPYAGVRVLDLTRVIAGPVATSFLAAHGADVLRIDPPGFTELPALLPVTTAGKRCAQLDLAAPRDRETLAQLVEGADVLFEGLRPGALERLGLGVSELARINPSLITVALDAYGWEGPLHARRGFDSLVQMSCGIAHAGMEAAGLGRPLPLPAQALDHATGMIAAAAVGAALTAREREGTVRDVRCSLIGTANVLLRHHTPDQLVAQGADWGERDTEQADTAWGRVRRVPVPATIAGHTPRLPVVAGPLRRHEPRWIDRT
jgi:hypothetical protein